MTCDTNKATRSKTKKLLSLAATKFCNSMLRATPAVPTQSFFRLWIYTFLDGKILLLFHQKTVLCCEKLDSFSLSILSEMSQNIKRALKFGKKKIKNWPSYRSRSLEYAECGCFTLSFCDLLYTTAKKWTKNYNARLHGHCTRCRCR